MVILLFALAVLLALITVLAIINRFSLYDTKWVETTNGKTGTAPTEISVITWNIGFAALDASAAIPFETVEFWRPEHRGMVEKNAEKIADYLGAQSADLILLQEAADAGFLNRNVPVRRKITERLAGFSTGFWADMRLVNPLQSLSIRHGLETYTNIAPKSYALLEFPQDEVRFFYGLLKKFYGGLVSCVSIDGENKHWVIINLHLSAFDPDAQVREAQLDTVFDFAQKAFAAGDFVVIGGDWNMDPTAGDNLHMEPFKKNRVPANWSFAFDPKVPSVRGTDAPFEAGKSPTGTIDGFIVSPNVTIKNVVTKDLNFANTDHHPVHARFRANL